MAVLGQLNTLCATRVLVPVLFVCSLQYNEAHQVKCTSVSNTVLLEEWKNQTLCVMFKNLIFHIFLFVFRNCYAVLWRTAVRLPGAYPSLLLWSKAAPQPHIWLTWLYGCRNSVWLKEQHYTNNHIIKSSVLIELWLYKSSKWSLTGLMDKIEPNQICLWILQCRVSFMWSGSDHS